MSNQKIEVSRVLQVVGKMKVTGRVGDPRSVRSLRQDPLEWVLIRPADFGLRLFIDQPGVRTEVPITKSGGSTETMMRVYISALLKVGVPVSVHRGDKLY